MNIFYTIVKNLFIWTVPLLLVLYSIAFLSINPQIHKETLIDMDFYSKAEDILSDQNENTLENGISGIVFNLTMRELVTQDWLQSVFEGNIDLITAWFAGKEDNLAFYFPTTQIEENLRSNIDQKIREEVDENKSQINTCSLEAAQTIQREGFDPRGEFCLPQSVKNGEEDLSSFLQSESNENILDSLFRNNPIPSSGETVNIDSLDSLYSTSQNQFFRLTNVLRDIFVFLRSLWIVVLVAFIGVLAVILLLAKTSGKKITSELRHILWTIGLSTAILSVTVIIVGGGSVYLNSLITQSLTSFVSSEIINLFALAAVRITFNLVSFAFWISLALIAFSGLLYGLEKSGLLENKLRPAADLPGNSGGGYRSNKPRVKPPSYEPSKFSGSPSPSSSYNRVPSTAAGQSTGGNRSSQSKSNSGYEPHEILKEHPEFPKVDNTSEIKNDSKTKQNKPVFQSSSLLNEDGDTIQKQKPNQESETHLQGSSSGQNWQASTNKPLSEPAGSINGSSQASSGSNSSNRQESVYAGQPSSLESDNNGAGQEKNRSGHDAYASSSRFNQNQEKSKYSSLSSKPSSSSSLNRPPKNKVIEANNNKSKIAGL
jgi:hypothetical protein